MELSALLKLNKGDLVRGAVTAVFAAVVVALGSVVQEPNFNLFTVDWGAVGGNALNVAFYALVGYLGKNLLTDSNGKVLGKIG